MFKVKHLLRDDQVLGGEAAPAEGGGAPAEAAPIAVETPASGEKVELPEWINDIDEDYRGEKSLHSIKSVADLAKGYVHAQKLIGKDKIALPDANSSEEEKAAFYAKLGKPESLEEYGVGEKLAANEEAVFSDDFISSFKQKAFESNILPEQAQVLLDELKASRIAEDTAMEADADRTMSEGIEELKKEWGEEGFSANAARANTVIKEFGFEGFNEYLAESGLSNDPMLIRLLANVGKGLNEDTFNRNAVSNLGLTKQDAQDKVDKIMSNMDDPYWNSEHAGHLTAQKEMARLQETLAK